MKKNDIENIQLDSVRKKILFLSTDLGIGGIASSMVNTANELSKFYDVSIYCLNPNGALREKLLPCVHVLPSDWRAKSVCLLLKDAKKCGFKFFCFKVFARLWSVVFNNSFPIRLILKHQPHLGYYDLACSFTHEKDKHIEYTGLIRFLIEKVDSPYKTSWVHCDYNFMDFSTYNDKYYNAIDSIVGVSESVANAFDDNHPYVRTRIENCPNMQNYDMIYKLSNERQDTEFIKDGIVCFSACRLSYVKAIPRAIRAFASVLKGNNVYWYIAGDGDRKQEIINTAKECGVEDRIILLGEKINPFPYIKNCDLYLSTSYQEAAPMVYGEAKALHTPVFSTETLSSKELLDENIDFICENNEQDMQRLFEIATSDKSELARRRLKLKDYVGTNKRAIDTFKKWLGDYVK